MPTITRRHVITAAAIAGAAAAAAPTISTASNGRTTIIYAPHPDDELLYLGAYIQFATQRGDRMVLVAATNGDASGYRPAGWTKADLAQIRRVEQAAAWRVLTSGRGDINWLGNPDSAAANLRSQITSYAQAYEGPGVEHYAACNNGLGQGRDHDEVALGLRQAGVRIARFANRYDQGGTLYTPTSLEAMKVADGCYRAFGHLSAQSFFPGFRAAGYPSRVTR